MDRFKSRSCHVRFSFDDIGMGVNDRNSIHDLEQISTSSSVVSSASRPDGVSAWIGKLVIGDHRDGVVLLFDDMVCFNLYDD